MKATVSNCRNEFRSRMKCEAFCTKQIGTLDELKNRKRSNSDSNYDTHISPESHTIHFPETSDVEVCDVVSLPKDLSQADYVSTGSDLFDPSDYHEKVRIDETENKDEHSHCRDDFPTFQVQQIDRDKLLKKKLEKCSELFDFFKSENGHRIVAKRYILIDLVTYLNTSEGKQQLSRRSIRLRIMKMIRINLSSMESQSREPDINLSWLHLEFIYELLLLVVHETGQKECEQIIDRQFCLMLISLFNSEDHRERRALKYIVHRIYKSFQCHRQTIRDAITNEFIEFVYETEKHNGVKEMLEFYECIISGFSSPLKNIHRVFLERVLIPLHRPRSIESYHKHLVSCIKLYVEKDPEVSKTILKSLNKMWPWTNIQKQILFLSEFEMLWELVTPDQFEEMTQTICKLLSRLIGSTHYQIVERTLFLWNNDILVNKGYLREKYSHVVLPCIYKLLREHAENHFNDNVASMAQCLLADYQVIAPEVYQSCQENVNIQDNIMRKLQMGWEDLETRLGKR